MVYPGLGNGMLTNRQPLGVIVFLSYNKFNLDLKMVKM